MSRLSVLVAVERKLQRVKRRNMRYARLRKAARKAGVLLAEVVMTLGMFVAIVCMILLVNSW